MDFRRRTSWLLVVHCKLAPYDVYIGRGRDPKTGRRGQYGNDYSHKESTLARPVASAPTMSQTVPRIEPPEQLSGV